MKFFVIAIVLSFSKISVAETFLSSEIKIHTQEILIASGDVAREIYEALHVKEVEAQLVTGLWFKNDKYLFCWIEPGGEYYCSFYLDFSGKGRLSSYETNTDYGKGSFLDFLENKPVVGKGRVFPMKWGMDIVVTGELAKRLRKKLYRAFIDRKRKMIRGEQIACSEVECLVRVPFRKIDPGDGAIQID